MKGFSDGSKAVGSEGGPKGEKMPQVRVVGRFEGQGTLIRGAREFLVTMQLEEIDNVFNIDARGATDPEQRVIIGRLTPPANHPRLMSIMAVTAGVLDLILEDGRALSILLRLDGGFRSAGGFGDQKPVPKAE
jgi:hypothetical protein